MRAVTGIFFNYAKCRVPEERPSPHLIHPGTN
jgi:hypothetical protein